MPTDGIPHKLARLLLELIASGELPELAVGGAWAQLNNCLSPRPALGPVALEADICGLAVAGLRTVGSAADWVVSLVSSLVAYENWMSCVCRDNRSVLLWLQSISRGDAGKAFGLVTVMNWIKLFTGQPQRSDLEAIVTSGLFDECAGAVAAVAATGVEGLHDTDHCALVCSLSLLRTCRGQPGCEAKLRQLAPALAFCLEHDLDLMEQLGVTTASYAAQICARS
jgi:hypothetical protein|eukprot:COSAG06_NODE_7513_length_2478_cov_56.278689_3_plen_225_part_00